MHGHSGNVHHHHREFTTKEEVTTKIKWLAFRQTFQTVYNKNCLIDNA